MSYFNKIKEITYVNSPEQFHQRGSNKIFSASIDKISTLNKDVLGSEWTLSSRALRLRLVCNRHRVWPILSLLMTASSRWDRDDFCWWPSTVVLIACNLFPVQLFQNCSHFSEISLVTQWIRSVAGTFIGVTEREGRLRCRVPLFITRNTHVTWDPAENYNCFTNFWKNGIVIIINLWIRSSSILKPLIAWRLNVELEKLQDFFAPLSGKQHLWGAEEHTAQP